MAIKYPPKPWRDGQVESLIPGIEFMYNLALRNWVPISPGYVSDKQLQKNFGVSTVEELKVRISKSETRIDGIDSDVDYVGRIWKTRLPPNYAKKNDVWIDLTTGKAFTFVGENRTWVELNYVG